MRAGQFWVFLGFSLAIMATTLLDQTPTQSTALNAACVGFALLAFAIFELSGLHLWMERLQIALGVWLALSPFVLPGAAWGRRHVGACSVGFEPCRHRRVSLVPRPRGSAQRRLINGWRDVRSVIWRF